MPGGATPGTATLISSLPYTDSETTPSPPDALWWRYVGFVGDITLGVFAPCAADTIRLSVFASDAVTPYPVGQAMADIRNKPLQIPISAGVTIYLKIYSPATPGAFTLSVLAAPRLVAPVGSIIINDDKNGFPAAILSGTDGTDLQFRAPVVAGENADILPSAIGGVSLFHDRYGSKHHILYSSDLSVLADIPYSPVNNVQPISTNRVDTFYVGQSLDVAHGSKATVTTIDATGAFGPTTWTISSGNGTLLALAPSLDETILYYAEVGVGNDPVHRWNLSTDTALSDLAPGQGGYFTGPDLFVLLDDTILVLYKRTAVASAPKAIRYATDGTVLNTYTFTGFRSSDARLATALDDPVSFWAWTKNLPPSHFWNVRVSDGVVLTEFDTYEFEAGIWNAAGTLTPAVRFGHSESCPFILTRVAIPVAAPITGTMALTLPPVSGSPSSEDAPLEAALTGYRLPPRHDDLLCQVIMTIASLAPDARQRMFNSLGVILSGAKLQTYEAGTTTPLATYSDAALTVPNSNPVIADSSGLFGPIYLLAQSYKFVLYDSNNLLVWSQDNVWDVGELLQATITALTASVAANLALTQTKFCTTAFSQATSASLANIIGLTGFTLTAGGVYKFDINLAGTSGASGGVKYAFKYTTATLTNLEASGIGTTASAVACQNATSTTDQATLYGQTAAVLNTRITGRITVNVGGTLAVQAAQNASDGTATTVAVGSWATFTKVS